MGFYAFFKKEITEMIKTQKAYILPAVFLFFGLLSPVTAKFMPQLMQQMLSDYGINMDKLMNPVYLDSYSQLFKNISQMFFVVVLVFSGMIVNEKTKGTALLVLTKPLSRASFILGKFFSAMCLYTFSYLLSCLACIYYTYLLFKGFYTPELFNGLLYGLFLLWLYGMFLICLTIFAGTAAKSFTVSAVSGVAFFLLMSAVSAIPKLGFYSPGIFVSMGYEILAGTKPIKDSFITLLITVVASLLMLSGSIVLFKRQEL